MIENLNLLSIPAMISGTCLVLIIVFYKWTYKSKRTNLWIALSVFFAIYTFVVGNAAMTDINYQKELDSFDLNQDGIFSEDEISPEQEAVMFNVTNDLGRNLSIFTGAFFALIFGIFAYVIAWAIKRDKRLAIEEKTKHNNVLR